jgi:uracil-DNA glycosylase
MTDTHDTRFDYTLDERQQSMLQAVGITLWLPPAAPAPQSEVQSTTLKADASVEKFKENRLLDQEGRARGAIETIANRVTQSEQNAPTTKSSLAISPTRAPDTAQPSVKPAMRLAGVDQMDWLGLQSAVANCQACGLCESRRSAVFGAGQASAADGVSPKVDWLIVGDAPDEEEDAQGQPFVGQAGQLLDNMLAAMKVGKTESGKATGLSRNLGVYITPAVKCSPPVSRNASPEEIATCAAYLAQQIELLRPTVILAMGKSAIASLICSNEPLGKLRGRAHALQHAGVQAPVIVTYHPLFLLRNPQEKAKAWADLQLAMQTFAERSVSS